MLVTYCTVKAIKILNKKIPDPLEIFVLGHLFF